MISYFLRQFNVVLSFWHKSHVQRPSLFQLAVLCFLSFQILFLLAKFLSEKLIGGIIITPYGLNFLKEITKGGNISVLKGERGGVEITGCGLT